jgi:hypothetical protein
MCWNGPKEGTLVLDVPMSARVGHACAIPWKTIEGKAKYAVYILLERPNGAKGLVYERSYHRPFQAEQRVKQITALVEAAVQSTATALQQQAVS